jgi:ABC-type multidrug transport system permease subunit
LAFLQFANFSELPLAVANKYIAYKHISQGMYPPTAFAIVTALVHIPIAAMEAMVFSAIIYFMAGLGTYSMPC